MKLSVFVGTSLDGFIARRNGEYDFLPAGGGEPHGYDEFIASVDTILIGRNTFEVVLKLPTWPYSDKRVVVLSHRPRVPVLIGEGIPLFGSVRQDIKLRHLHTRQYESGLVSSQYEVVR